MERKNEKFTIYLAGDSTVQSYKTPVKPITGWGQMLHTYFKETEQKMNQDGCDWMGYGQRVLLILTSQLFMRQMACLLITVQWQEEAAEATLMRVALMI